MGWVPCTPDRRSGYRIPAIQLFERGSESAIIPLSITMIRNDPTHLPTALNRDEDGPELKLDGLIGYFHEFNPGFERARPRADSFRMVTDGVDHQPGHTWLFFKAEDQPVCFIPMIASQVNANQMDAKLGCPQSLI